MMPDCKMDVTGAPVIASSAWLGRSVEIPTRRVFEWPRSDTFDMPYAAGLVHKYLHVSKISIDPFARNKRWATHTNDINPNTAAEHHMDAVDFLKLLAAQGVMADCILIDPPYSPRQISECYQEAGLKVTMRDTQNGRLYKEVRSAADAVMARNGIVITFGWSTSGMQSDDYEPVELLILNHGAGRNDTLCLVERKTQNQMVML